METDSEVAKTVDFFKAALSQLGLILFVFWHQIVLEFLLRDAKFLKKIL